MEGKQCSTCVRIVGEFRDDLSRAEHRISGMCQQCQDETFHDADECEDLDCKLCTAERSAEDEEVAHNSLVKQLNRLGGR